MEVDQVASTGSSNPLLRRFQSRKPAASRLWGSTHVNEIRAHAGSTDIGAMSRATAELFSREPPDVQAHWQALADKQQETDADQCFQYVTCLLIVALM